MSLIRLRRSQVRREQREVHQVRDVFSLAEQY